MKYLDYKTKKTADGNIEIKIIKQDVTHGGTANDKSILLYKTKINGQGCEFRSFCYVNLDNGVSPWIFYLLGFMETKQHNFVPIKKEHYKIFRRLVIEYNIKRKMEDATK